MAPLWPFKKKEPVAELDEEPPAPVVYKRGEDPHTRSSVSTDAAAYQDALALFGGGSHEVEAATDLAAGYDGVTEDTTVSSAVKRTESSATDMKGWFDEGMLPPHTPKGTITRYPVSRDINRPGINHPGLVEPLRTLFDQEYGV